MFVLTTSDRIVAVFYVQWTLVQYFRRWHGTILYFCACSWWKSAYPPLFVALAFGNAFDDCNIDGRIKSSNEKHDDSFAWLEIVWSLSLFLQGSPKNLVQFLCAVTISYINWFSKLFHCQNREKICNNTVTKYLSTPPVSCYIRLWNVTEWGKLSQRFTDHAIGRWCRRLECVVQQQGGHIIAHWTFSVKTTVSQLH